MKSTRKLAQIFLFLSITTSFVFATIHEDEIGVYDWYKENVGEILTADYYVTPSKKNVIVSTDENVIAAISLKSGEIVWRQVLFDDETLQSFETKGNIAFTLSHSSKTNLYSLRYWDVTDGSLLWDDTLAVTTAAASLHYDDVIIVTNNFIQLKSSKDGNAIWTKERTLKSTKLLVIQSFPQEFIVVSVSGNNADILSFNAKDGNLKKEQQVSFPANFEVKEIEIVNDLVVILGNQQNLLTYKLSGNSGSFTPLSNEKLVVTEGSHLESHSSQVFTLQNKFNSIIFKLKNDQVEILHQSQKKAFSVSLTEENTILYASIITDNSIEIIDLSNKKSQIVPIFDLGNHGNVKRSFLNMFTPKKENAATSYRLLIITQDNCATLLTEGTVTWQREESLASVVKAEIMDLPSSHVFDSIAHTIDEDVTINFISGFVVRVTAQIQQLIETLTGKSSKVINEDLLIKDRFGFKQLVLLYTKVGKLFALHTEKGQVVWSRFLPGVQISNIMVTRTAAFYPPELLVTGNKVNEYSELYWINPLNGQVNKQEFLSFKISQAVKLSQHDYHGNHYVMLVENSAKVHVYPNNIESISFFKNHNFTLFFYSVDHHNNQVNGYMIDQQIDNTNQFTVINVWAVPFSTGETIAAVAHSNWNEQVYAPARILGDRSALPKYINKNMVAIATTKTSQEDSVLSIYLIDTVTGNLVHNSYHSRAGGPVHLVLSDNWVLYHYWNTQHKRFEFSVLEIFEKEIDWKGITYSSFDKIPELNILQKAFVFSNNLRTMSVSTTTHGITPKQLLVGLETGQIIALPKSFLDPRRPPKAEYLPEHREEGLIPYHHTILPSPKSYINYYKKISKLNKIVTAPSTLESTCLVFAFGLDNFYTRIAPSGTFDLLNPDFNYVALIITSIVISVLTVFSMWLSKKRQLQKLWN